MKTIEVRLEYKQENFLNDVQDIPRAFSPYLIVREDAEHFLGWDYSYDNTCLSVTFFSDIFAKKVKKEEYVFTDLYSFRKEVKHYLKCELYRFLSEELQIKLPYGSLTGVRPTKLYYELLENSQFPEEILVEKYDVSQEKTNLIANCVKNQKKYKNADEKSIGFFVNIPFCPTRCKYCSFISTEVFRVKKELPFYVECVKKEIEESFRIMEKNGYSVSSVYVGGGTPTSIGATFLNEIISPLKNLGVEFTVEAGRPDAIDKDIIATLKKNNVTRVSVNPQTFHNETLERIGRKHTIEDFMTAYDLMTKAGFSVNVDLIAGLPGESYDDFLFSIDSAIRLKPDNLTVHTLSLKRGSSFTVEGMEKREYGLVGEMVSYAHSALDRAGYVPYYMYRQKNMADNLENTGYTLPGKQCVYNIDMMEESASIIGVGAGSMSKLIVGDRIERFSDPKGFREYCERIIDTIERKKTFFTL